MKPLLASALALSLLACRDHRVLQPTLALPRPGTVVPTFTYPTMGGGRVQSAARGTTPTVLFLWSTHCPTSRRALTGYRDLLREYAGHDVRIVMLSDDQGDAEVTLLPKLLADSGVRGDVALAHGQLGKVFDQSATAPERDTARVEFVLPAYLVIDMTGRVVARSWGPNTGSIRHALDSLIASRRPTQATAATATGRM